MTRFWIGVACREHVLKGVEGGFAQVCHGKRNPLQRMRGGDWIAYYSSVERLGETTPCRRFTAIGKIGSREPEQVRVSEEFSPFRRDVAFVRTAREADVTPLIPALSFITNETRWGFPFMRGFFEVTAADFELISHHMGTSIDSETSLESESGITPAPSESSMTRTSSKRVAGKRLREVEAL